MGTTRYPTREELAAAADLQVPDILAGGLRVIFCGINPSLYSAAVGHHFAGPGNRFWRALHGAGFTPRVLAPDEDQTLPEYGAGITNLVDRATARASELTRSELSAGRLALVEKVTVYRPTALAVLGIDAYRRSFEAPQAGFGLQDLTISGTQLWVLPNPSGLNASYRLADLIRIYRNLSDVLS